MPLKQFWNYKKMILQRIKAEWGKTITQHPLWLFLELASIQSSDLEAVLYAVPFSLVNKLIIKKFQKGGPVSPRRPEPPMYPPLPCSGFDLPNWEVIV